MTEKLRTIQNTPHHGMKNLRELACMSLCAQGDWEILLDHLKARKKLSFHWRCSGSSYAVHAIDVFGNKVVLLGL